MLTLGVNLINSLYSSLMVRQEKLECFSQESYFSLVYNLLVRQEVHNKALQETSALPAKYLTSLKKVVKENNTLAFYLFVSEKVQ
jgi:hypothetical protein